MCSGILLYLRTRRLGIMEVKNLYRSDMPLVNARSVRFI